LRGVSGVRARGQLAVLRDVRAMGRAGGLPAQRDGTPLRLLDRARAASSRARLPRGERRGRHSELRAWADIDLPILRRAGRDGDRRRVVGDLAHRGGAVACGLVVAAGSGGPPAGWGGGLAAPRGLVTGAPGDIGGLLVSEL